MGNIEATAKVASCSSTSRFPSACACRGGAPARRKRRTAPLAFVEVAPTSILVNCPRYIHRYARGSRTRSMPHARTDRLSSRNGSGSKCRGRQEGGRRDGHRWPRRRWKWKSRRGLAREARAATPPHAKSRKRERDPRMLDILYTTIDRYSAVYAQSASWSPAIRVLAWLIFAGLNLLTFLLLWFYGLLQKALDADPTHISRSSSRSSTLQRRCTACGAAWQSHARRRRRAPLRFRSRKATHSPHRHAQCEQQHRGWGLSAHVRDLMTKTMRLPKEQKLDRRCCCASWRSASMARPPSAPFTTTSS